MLACVFVTAAYTFRMVFMAFHGKPRFDPHHPPHESPPVVTVPLVLLAIPSVLAGYLIGDFVFGDYFGDSLPPPDAELLRHLAVHRARPDLAAVLARRRGHCHGLAVCTSRRPDLPARVANFFGPAYSLVERKYGFDELYSWLLAGGARNLGTGFWRGGDQAVIDGMMVNGSARVVGWFSGVVRLIQTGLLNTYAFLILFGILARPELGDVAVRAVSVPLLSLAIWIPILAGLAVLAAGNGDRARRARALDRARRRARSASWSRSRSTPASTRRAPTSSSRKSCCGSSASTSITTSASTASRCCSCC